jgi:uncharacterized membrane protein (DUF4010 family)
MTGIDSSLVHDFIAVIFCGAFVGMEREFGKWRREDAGPELPESGNLAGIRTHTLVAILGAVARVLDRETAVAPWTTCVGLAVTALFAVSAYGVRAVRSGRYGMTSVPTLLLTYGLGALCLSGQRPLAVALAVVVTAILAFKVPLHSFVRALTQQEVLAAVKFALLALVLLPVLPDQDYGPGDWPWLAERLQAFAVPAATLARLALFNPYRLWLIVVVISGLGFVGYVLVRLLGPGRGLLLTGLAGGLVSSTSVTLAMAERSRTAPQWRHSIVAAVLAACAAMSVRVFLIAVVLYGGLLVPLGPPLGALMLANVIIAIWLSRRADRAVHQEPMQVGTPLALGPALRLAGLIVLVRLLSEVATFAIGDAGLFVMAVLSGGVDVDPITVTTGQQAAASRIGDGFATGVICTAVAANTVVKGLLMLWTAERATARVAFAAMAGTLLAGLVGFGVSVWVRLH